MEERTVKLRSVETVRLSRLGRMADSLGHAADGLHVQSCSLGHPADAQPDSEWQVRLEKVEKERDQVELSANLAVRQKQELEQELESTKAMLLASEEARNDMLESSEKLRRDFAKLQADEEKAARQLRMMKHACKKQKPVIATAAATKQLTTQTAIQFERLTRDRDFAARELLELKKMLSGISFSTGLLVLAFAARSNTHPPPFTVAYSAMAVELNTCVRTGKRSREASVDDERLSPGFFQVR